MIDAHRLMVLDAAFDDIDVEREAAAQFGVSVERLEGQASGDLADTAMTADGILVQYRRIDAATIDRCPSWRVIGRYGVGVDNVDVEAASRQGIAVINVPDYCVEEVATHASAMVLSAWRKLHRSAEVIASGGWGAWQAVRPVRRLSTCTLGIVGAGRIGAETARMLGPLFERTVAHDPAGVVLPGSDSTHLDDLFATADVVSLHCPLTPATEALVDADRLKLMKRDALLVNVSRGGLIDGAALNAALRENQIGGAALDVLPSEPPEPDDPLLTAPGLLLTNHVAWYSEESLIRLRHLLAARCARYLAGGDGETVVNGDEIVAAKSEQGVRDAGERR